MYKKRSQWKRDSYEIEEHPFNGFHIPENADILIIGTFPTYRGNSQFDFFYSGENNLFWEVIGKVFNHTFKFNAGDEAVKERTSFLGKRGIGITDMHLKCYRKNKMSGDEYLFPIILNDIFELLNINSSIKTIVLTSRTEAIGALGLLKTYFLQKGLELKQPKPVNGKVLGGVFQHGMREIKVLVSYSTSPRVLEDGKISKADLVEMYRYCLTKTNHPTL